MKASETKPSIQEGHHLTLHIDGASRGNPGKAGAGIWITDGRGRTLLEIGRYLGHKTNNEAEYWALLLGARQAKRLGGKFLHIFTDSELIERQMKGLYRVKDLHLKLLYKAVMQDLKNFSSFEIQAIPREQNQEADRLANEAIQRWIVKEKGRGESRKRTDGRSSNHSVPRNERGEESPSSKGQGGP